MLQVFKAVMKTIFTLQMNNNQIKINQSMFTNRKSFQMKSQILQII